MYVLNLCKHSKLDAAALQSHTQYTNSAYYGTRVYKHNFFELLLFLPTAHHRFKHFFAWLCRFRSSVLMLLS